MRLKHVVKLIIYVSILMPFVCLSSPKGHGLLIGIDLFEHINESVDARERELHLSRLNSYLMLDSMKNFLENGDTKIGAFEDVDILYNEAATASKVDLAFKELTARVKKEEPVVIYMHSHGVRFGENQDYWDKYATGDAGDQSQELDSYDEGFVLYRPTEETSARDYGTFVLRDQTLANYIQSLYKKTRNITLIIVSCYAGGLFRSNDLNALKTAYVPVANNLSRYRFFSDIVGIYSSSEFLKTSFDTREKSKNFTSILVNQFRKYGKSATYKQIVDFTKLNLTPEMKSSAFAFGAVNRLPFTLQEVAVPPLWQVQDIKKGEEKLWLAGAGDPLLLSDTQDLSFDVYDFDCLAKKGWKGLSQTEHDCRKLKVVASTPPVSPFGAILRTDLANVDRVKVGDYIAPGNLTQKQQKRWTLSLRGLRQGGDKWSPLIKFLKEEAVLTSLTSFSDESYDFALGVDDFGLFLNNREGLLVSELAEAQAGPSDLLNLLKPFAIQQIMLGMEENYNKRYVKPEAIGLRLMTSDALETASFKAVEEVKPHTGQKLLDLASYYQIELDMKQAMTHLKNKADDVVVTVLLLSWDGSIHELAKHELRRSSTLSYAKQTPETFGPFVAEAPLDRDFYIMTFINPISFEINWSTLFQQLGPGYRSADESIDDWREKYEKQAYFRFSLMKVRVTTNLHLESGDEQAHIDLRPYCQVTEPEFYHDLVQMLHADLQPSLGHSSTLLQKLFGLKKFPTSQQRLEKDLSQWQSVDASQPKNPGDLLWFENKKQLALLVDPRKKILLFFEAQSKQVTSYYQIFQGNWQQAVTFRNQESTIGTVERNNFATLVQTESTCQ